MSLNQVAGVLRCMGAIATFISLATILDGLRRSNQRATSQAGGKVLSIVHSPATLVPLSVVGMGILAALWRPLPLRLPARADGALTLLGAILFFPGIALFLWGRRTMAEMYDVSTSTGTRLYADHRLVTTGPFAYVRHPLYVAGTLAEIGAVLMYRTWSTAVILANVFSLVRRSRREEEALAAQFGEEWEEYKQRVPGWLPRFNRAPSR